MRTLIFKFRVWLTRRLDDLADWVDPDYESDEEVHLTTIDELIERELERKVDREWFGEYIARKIKNDAEEELGM